MTRKTTFRTFLLGATALTLASCGEPKEEVLVFESVETCVASGEHDEATCRAEFEKARHRHEQVAPRYSSANSCHSDFGVNQCRRHQTSSGSFWLPFMVGYMLAPRGVSTVYTQPLYHPSSGRGYYTGGGVSVGTSSDGSFNRNGRTQVAKSTTSRPATRTRTVSRGGFGARSAGRSAAS